MWSQSYVKNDKVELIEAEHKMVLSWDLGDSGDVEGLIKDYKVSVMKN